MCVYLCEWCGARDGLRFRPTELQEKPGMGKDKKLFILTFLYRI